VGFAQRFLCLAEHNNCALSNQIGEILSESLFDSVVLQLECNKMGAPEVSLFSPFVEFSFRWCQKIFPPQASV
jgi:hypothetical protein